MRTTMTQSLSVRVLATVVGIAMVLTFAGAFAQTASAQTVTIESLLAQIAALQAQLTALQGGATSGAGCYAFTRDLSDGSQGADVTALQNYLTGTGHFTFSGGATGYFGPITTQAVAAWQAANGVAPAAGYWGPLSKAKYNTVCTPATPTPTPTPTPGSGDLEGGAGSVEDYTLDTTYTNEEVGEDENDVIIAALDIEADENSDLEILAVKLDFDDNGTANNSADLRKYLEDVSIWFDGEEVANSAASKFTDDNNYGRTLSLDPGVIIRAGETGTLEARVSGVTNLDSSDAGDSWDVDFESVRFADAQGTVISEDPGVAVTIFTVESFITSADTKFKILAGDDSINDAHIIDVDATSATDNVDIFSFKVKIEGDADVEVDDLTIEGTVTGAGFIDEMFDALSLYMDGDKVDTVTTPTDDDTVTFDDLNLTLEGGQTYDFVVAVDFLSTGGALDEGDTVSFTIGETETDLGVAFTDIKDASGDQLSDANKSGSATSGAHAAHDVGIIVELVSTSAVAANNDTAADDDVGTFTMVFDITAFGGSVYVGDTAAGTTVADGSFGIPVTDAIVYRVYDSGTATTDDLADTISFTTPAGVTDSTNNILITDGATSRVTLTVTQTNDTTEDDGIYYLDLAGIGWGIADDTTYEFTYTFNLDEFETTTISLN